MLETTDLLDLRQFFQRLDQAAAELLDERDRYGHVDLSGYLPWMGPRYGFRGRDVPLSIFRGEGIALFLLARTLKPAVIAECYTGTGYAAACLAAGAPTARVLSVDNYSEGGVGDEGFRVAQAIRDRLDLTHLDLIRGSTGELNARLNGRSVDVYLSDGPYGGAPNLDVNVTVIRHDAPDGQVPERSFTVIGGSNLSVMCATVERRDALAAEMGGVCPVRLG